MFWFIKTKATKRKRESVNTELDIKNAHKISLHPFNSVDEQVTLMKERERKKDRATHSFYSGDTTFVIAN